MRADLAPFGVDAVLAIAGLGILVGIGLVPWRLRSVIAALGLAYLTGVAVVPLALTLMLVVGIPLTLASFLVAALACVGIGALLIRRRGRTVSFRPTHWRWRAWRTWTAETWVAVTFAALFAAYWLVGLVSAFEMPLTAWDAWSIWARKAEMLTVHDSLISGFFTNQSYAFAHLDYPLQYPIWEALHFRAGAVFDTQTLLRHVWLLLGAFAWAMAYLLRERVRPVVWAPLLLLTAVAPGVWEQLLSGYADVPMAMFVCLGVISLGMWLHAQDTRLLVLAALMLAAAANTKNEGAVAALAILAVGGAIALSRRLAVRTYLLSSFAVILTVLPWRMWLIAHGIEGDMPVAKGLDPGYLAGRIDRVGPAISAINGQLAEQGRWLELLPLAALVVAVSLISGVGRRTAAFYLGSFVVVWMAFVWSYWISPHNLAWHLATSVDRVVSIPMFICIAALLHLSGMLVGSLASGPRDERERPAESADEDLASSTLSPAR
ncbi:MAG TPA: hypothetical protein VE197_12130 [Mycobacterium sp.]|nr:hypothetical protein [Mycobacterium sp.]